MVSLSPQYSAQLAEDIYDLKLSLRRERFKKLYKNDFDVEGKNLNGNSGAFIFLKSTHTMGIAAHGINKYAGQAFVALKGTASGYDILTDLNAGLKKFHTGGSVHTGFFYTFQSFLPDLDKFISTIPAGIHTIHCVGHSLGGALATLVADYLKSKCTATVKLYTFGSPRVGLGMFADAARRRLGQDNIFRVYHRTDPIPMIPTWPFIHIPNSGPGDFLLQSSAALNPIEYHKMKNYKGSIEKHGMSEDWELMKRMRPQAPISHSIESWLNSDGPLSLTLNTAWFAAEAMLWVLKKVGELLSIGLVITGGSTFTLLDQLAIMLKKAYDFGKQLSHWVIRLIIRLGKLIGIVVEEGTNITAIFIRTIFIRLHTAVSELVLRAGRNVDN